MPLCLTNTPDEACLWTFSSRFSDYYPLLILAQGWRSFAIKMGSFHGGFHFFFVAFFGIILSFAMICCYFFWHYSGQDFPALFWVATGYACFDVQENVTQLISSANFKKSEFEGIQRQGLRDSTPGEWKWECPGTMFILRHFLVPSPIPLMEIGHGATIDSLSPSSTPLFPPPPVAAETFVLLLPLGKG